jgi:hypothetical protein
MGKGLICEILHPLTKTYIDESFYFFVFLKQIEKSIAKKEHHIEMADGPGEDKPKSTRAPKFTKNIAIQMWLITPSNFLAITRTHSVMQTPNPIKGF